MSFAYHNLPPISVSFTTNFQNIGVGYAGIGIALRSGSHWLPDLLVPQNREPRRYIENDDHCATMAGLAQTLANTALNFWRGDASAALIAFDMSFSQKYLGNDGIGNSYESARKFAQAPIGPTVPIWFLGEKGFRPQFQDGEGDQTHHFAAFLTAGINGQWAAATLHQFSGDILVNRPDIRLGDAAYAIGRALKKGGQSLHSVGQRILKDICGK
jgi:hypothetical protein